MTSCMHWKGIYTFNAGSKYVGDFLNNKPSGQGWDRYADGQSYELDEQDGFIEGYGVMVYQDGAKYQEGIRYEGEWLNDMRHGNGEMIYLNDGRRLRGLFKENAFIGS